MEDSPPINAYDVGFAMVVADIKAINIELKNGNIEEAKDIAEASLKRHENRANEVVSDWELPEERKEDDCNEQTESDTQE